MFSAECRGQRGETAASSPFNPSLTDGANSLLISIGGGAGSLHAAQQNIAIGHSKWVIKMCHKKVCDLCIYIKFNYFLADTCVFLNNI